MMKAKSVEPVCIYWGPGLGDMDPSSDFRSHVIYFSNIDHEQQARIIEN